jgi:hypothetical protein
MLLERVAQHGEGVRIDSHRSGDVQQGRRCLKELVFVDRNLSVVLMMVVKWLMDGEVVEEVEVLDHRVKVAGVCV